MVAEYDMIGDVHGEARALEALLHKLGYVLKDNVFHHRGGDRTALFVGDEGVFYEEQLVSVLLDNLDAHSLEF